MSRFAVLLAGHVDPTEALRRRLAGMRVIAADGGIRHAEALGVRPELWVGDFDSVPEGMAGRWEAVPRLILPRDKARTDGEVAMGVAQDRGARDILLVGALGGSRSDHAFSNLVLLLGAAERGLEVELFDGRERAFALGPRTRRVEAEAGTPFSLLPFCDLDGVTIAGAKWPLDEARVPFGSLLTQSNEALGTVEVGVGQGRAALLLQAGPLPR